MTPEEDDFLPAESYIDRFIVIAMVAAIAVLVAAIWMLIGGLG